MEFMRGKSCVCIYGVEIEVKWSLCYELIVYVNRLFMFNFILECGVE